MMGPNVYTYIISSTTLCIGTYICGILPIFLRRTLLYCKCDGKLCDPKCRSRKVKFFISFLIYFGGGVLLATCFLFLVPDTSSRFELYFEQNIKRNETEEEEGGESFSIPDFVVCCGFFIAYLLDEMIRFLVSHYTHEPVPTKERAIHRFVSRGYHPAKTDSNSVETKKTHSSFSATGILAVLALSLHSFMEGYVLGLQKTYIGVWILVLGFGFYKLVLAFVVGLEALNCGKSEGYVYLYMSVFAATSPIGMAVAVVTNLGVHPFSVGILNGVATGTLLYVTFCEILQKNEGHKNITGSLEWLACILGFLAMSVLRMVYGSTVWEAQTLVA